MASGVAAELGDVAPASPETPVNRLAYEQLLIGRQHWECGDKFEVDACICNTLRFHSKHQVLHRPVEVTVVSSYKPPQTD